MLQGEFNKDFCNFVTHLIQQVWFVFLATGLDQHQGLQPALFGNDDTDKPIPDTSRGGNFHFHLSSHCFPGIEIITRKHKAGKKTIYFVCLILFLKTSFTNKKSLIRKTPTLSTDEDSRTNTILEKLCDFLFYFFWEDARFFSFSKKKWGGYASADFSISCCSCFW